MTQHAARRRIVVTGGAGFVGSHLVRALLARDPACSIVVVDDLSSGHADNVPKDPRVLFVKGSIVDQAVVATAFAVPPQRVFHLAALFANQNSVDHPEDDLATNGLGTLKVLEASRRAKVERVVYASSSCIYRPSQEPYHEDMPFEPETPYGITKFLGEQYAHFFFTFHRLSIATVRYFNVYGPGDRPGRYRSVIPNFFATARRGEALTITGDGSETRDFTYVGDVVAGTIAASDTPDASGGIFNLGTGTETRIADLAHAVNKLTGNTAPIVFKPRRDWDGITRRVANVERARQVLSYRPSTSLDDGLRATADWFRDTGAAG